MRDTADHSGATSQDGPLVTGQVAPPPGPIPPIPAIRAVLVDDHVLVREGTLQLLDQESDIVVVGQAGTAEEALGMLERTSPDIALVDINIPGTSGLDLARIAQERFPQVRILIVSAYDDYAYVTEAIEVGVGGYLLKTATAKELLDAVRAVAAGVFVLDRAVSDRLSRRWRVGPPVRGALTPREADVLGLLAKGLANKQIATELCLGLRTIESYVSNIYVKLGVASRTEAVLYALDHNLVGGGDHDGPTRSR